MENFYKDLISFFPDIVYQIDDENNFIYINNSISKLGYSPHELIGKHFNKILLPEEKDRVNREMSLSDNINENSVESGMNSSNEKKIGRSTTKKLKVNLLCNEGESNIAVKGEIFATGFYNKVADENKYLGAFGVIRVFDDQTDKSSKFIRIEKYYRLLLENSFGIIMVIANDGTILFTSESVKKNLGLETIDLIGENIEDIIHPDDFISYKYQIKKDVGIGYLNKKNEIRFRDINEEWKFFETAISPIVEHTTDNFMCYIFHANNISSQKKVELALEKRERIYKTILRTSPDAIMMFDAEDDLIFSNMRATEILGISRVDLLGRNFISLVAFVDREKALELRNKVRQKDIVHDYQLSIDRYNNEKVPIEISISSIKDNAENLEGSLAVFRDITKRKKAEEDREKLETELLSIILNRLSRREIELLQYISTGYIWPEDKRKIGKIMDVLPGTLDQFAARIKKKIDIDNLYRIADIANLHFKW
jgi:PAS domain S-box-containing protein